MAVGRAGLPALTGALNGYAAAMTLLTVLLLVAAATFAWCVRAAE